MNNLSIDVVQKITELSYQNDIVLSEIFERQSDIKALNFSQNKLDRYYNDSLALLVIKDIAVIIVGLFVLMSLFDTFSLVIAFIIILFRIIRISKNKEKILEYYDLHYAYHENTNHILYLLYQPLSYYIKSSVFVDMNSIKENGFSFVEEKYLQQYLDDEVKRNHLKITELTKSNIQLYQSTKPALHTADMATSYLQID